MAQKTKKTAQNSNVSKEDLLKEKEDVDGLVVHLEEEYRKANISEKNYQELKSKYDKSLKEIEEKLGTAEKEQEAPKPKEKKVEKGPKQVEKAEAPKEPEGLKEPEASAAEQAKKPRKGPGFGMFGKLLKRGPKKPKKGEPTQQSPESGENADERTEEEKLIEQAALAVGTQMGGAADMIEGAKEKMAEIDASQLPPDQGGTAVSPDASEEGGAAATEAGDVGPKVGVELEKLKVMIDTIRDAKKATDEMMQSLAENIGEVRSLTFQADGTMREVVAKMEKMEDEISDIKPTEISKKFTELSTVIEKQSMEMEKLNRKSEDLTTKINKVHNMMKGAGGIENLVDLNNQIQKKITDIKSIIKYIERLAFKTEKVFIDLNRGMEDFVIYKTKQEGLDETVKDLIKSWTKVSLDLENNYVSKADLNVVREDILGIQKEIAEFNKGLPVLQAKLPPPMIDLMEEREDIILFLESLEDSLKSKSISKEEYENVKVKNMEKLDILRNELKVEWGRLEEYSKKDGAGKEAEVPKEVKEAKAVEAKTAAPKPETESSPDEEATEPEQEQPKEEDVPKEETPPEEPEAPKEVEVKIEEKAEEEKEEKLEERVEKRAEEREEEPEEEELKKEKKPKPKKKAVPKKEPEEKPKPKEEPKEEVEEGPKDKPKEKKEEVAENSAEGDESVSTLITKIRTKMKDI